MNPAQPSTSRSAAARAAAKRRRCAAVVAALSAYLDQELDARAITRVESHLPHCRRCARALATLVVVIDGSARARGQRRDDTLARGFQRFTAVVARLAARGVAERAATNGARARLKRRPIPVRRSVRTPNASRRGPRST